jgi:hypothetical protein
MTYLEGEELAIHIHHKERSIMLDRIIGVFKLSKPTFAEIEHDPNATTEAAIIVAIVAFLSVIGSLIGALIGGQNLGEILLGLISTFVLVFINWFIWGAVTYFVGTQLFDGTADLGEMLRVIGYAQAPRFLGIIPCVGLIVGFIWSLIAAVIGIQEGLDFDLGKAIATAIIGWIIVIVIGAIVQAIFGLGSFGIGALGNLAG